MYVNRSDKRFVNCPHLHKLQLRFSRLRQCLFLKLEVTNARKLLPHGQNFGLGCSKSGYNPWIIQK